MVSLVVLAACGGNGGDGDGEAFELPAPGEYSFEVTGTMEIEFLEPGVSAAPLALGGRLAVGVGGDLAIQIAEDGSFVISDKNGMTIVAGEELEEGAEGGAFPITFTNDADKGSSGTITEDGTKMELNLVAELATGETATNEEPIRLEGEGDPFSDEGATLSTPPDAEAVNFVSADEVDPRLIFGIPALFIGLFGGFGFEEGADEEPATDEEPLEASCQQRGDVNGDGEVNSVDASLILQLNAGLIASLPCQEAADVNGDGAVTTEDAALILQFTAGFIESFPPDIPTDTEEQGAEFTDAEGDEYECASSEGVDDGDVDILSVGVTQVLDGVEVRVELRESPPEGQEWFSSSVQVKIGQEGRFQVGQSEVHDGTPNSGRIDDAGNVIPGSEADVDPEGKFVTFVVPSLDIEEGDSVDARAFHLEKEGDPVHCDVTDAYLLDELISLPCGGECTREE